MASLNLVRNSKVFFTTNVDATTGVIKETTSNGFSASNTFELQVLDGFSFSQNTNSEQITVSEAGVSPVRGQRSFNTSLAPVDWSMSTYLRPGKASTNVTAEEACLWNALFSSQALATTNTLSATTYTAPTWDATTGILSINGTGITSDVAVGDGIIISGITASGGTTAQQAAAVKAFNGPATVTEITGTSPSITVIKVRPANAQFYTSGATLAWSASTVFAKSGWLSAAGVAHAGTHGSNVNQLQKFGLLIIVDNVTYAIDNCALNEATVDFGLDGIATVQWTGQATALRQLSANLVATTTGASTSAAGTGTFTGGGVTGTSNYAPKTTGPGFITNKLSTCSLKTVKALGDASAGNAYYVALTGGSFTISNNISYVTPAIVGVVNQAVTYYTGTRSISGSINAYLNTGAAADSATYVAGGTGNLLKDMLKSAATVTEPMFELEIAIGGSSNSTRVELSMGSATITVPSINTEQVVSTSINFTAVPSVTASSTRAFDLGNTNDLAVRYYSATTNVNAA